MANSKSPKPKKASPSASTSRRKSLLGTLVVVVIVALVCVITHLKLVQYQVTSATDKTRTTKVEVKELEDRRPLFIVSGGYAEEYDFKVEDGIRIVPVGWQKYRLYINAKKTATSTDAIKLPINKHLYIKVKNKLPKGEYELLTKIHGTITYSLLTVKNRPYDNSTRKLQEFNDRQHFTID